MIIRNSHLKAGSVPRDDGDVVIGSDTVVVCNGELLGKPIDIEDAKRMVLLQLSYPQEVMTGLALFDGSSGRVFHGYEVSTVVMNGDPSVVDEYLASEKWIGKAGSYGIQDDGPLEAELKVGSMDNVIGLPMTLLERLLSLIGFRYPEKTPSGG
jgi:septum formation protein